MEAQRFKQRSYLDDPNGDASHGTHEDRKNPPKGSIMSSILTELGLDAPDFATVIQTAFCPTAQAKPETDTAGGMLISATWGQSAWPVNGVPVPNDLVVVNPRSIPPESAAFAVALIVLLSGLLRIGSLIPLISKPALGLAATDHQPASLMAFPAAVDPVFGSPSGTLTGRVSPPTYGTFPGLRP